MGAPDYFLNAYMLCLCLGPPQNLIKFDKISFPDFYFTFKRAPWHLRARGQGPAGPYVNPALPVSEPGVQTQSPDLGPGITPGVWMWSLSLEPRVWTSEPRVQTYARCTLALIWRWHRWRWCVNPFFCSVHQPAILVNDLTTSSQKI